MSMLHIGPTAVHRSYFRRCWPDAGWPAFILILPVAFGNCNHSFTDASYSRDRSTVCVVGAPFLPVAEGRKVYWEITILDPQGTVRVGFAGSNMSFGKKKRNEHIGQGQKSWALSSDNGNGYHRCESLF